MKANFTLFDPIQMEGKCAVMTGEDTDVKATQIQRFGRNTRRQPS
jgi:hypothetical protein